MWHVGMITANSFMKREFGKKLIEEFFPRLISRTSSTRRGAYIPGHGTPTVILFGRTASRFATRCGLCWVSRASQARRKTPLGGLSGGPLLKHIDRVGAQDDFTSAADVPKATFASHPWSIGGGGAAELWRHLTGTRKKRSLTQPLSSVFLE